MYDVYGVWCVMHGEFVCCVEITKIGDKVGHGKFCVVCVRRVPCVVSVVCDMWFVWYMVYDLSSMV